MDHTWSHLLHFLNVVILSCSYLMTWHGFTVLNQLGRATQPVRQHRAIHWNIAVPLYKTQWASVWPREQKKQKKSEKKASLNLHYNIRLTWCCYYRQRHTDTAKKILLLDHFLRLWGYRPINLFILALNKKMKYYCPGSKAHQQLGLWGYI